MSTMGLGGKTMAENQVVTKPAGRALLLAVENAELRKDIPEIKSGDTVRLQVKVVEGSRERLQPFEGVVMRLRGGGVNRNFTVRRTTHGVGVERTFLLNSPRIEKIEVIRPARVKELRPMTSKQLAAKEAARAAKVKVATVKETPVTSSDESTNE